MPHHLSELPGPLSSVCPLVGITSRHEPNTPNLVLRRAYIDAIVRAGGVPVALPIQPTEQIGRLVDALDALLLTGGEDINPLFYGSHPDPLLGAVDTERDEFELALARAWLASGKPLLGICRGLQVLHVALGGSLVQDLGAHWPGVMRHSSKGPRSNPAHEVAITPGTLLARLLETDQPVRVNSIHHQAACAPVLGWVASATAGDGVIEAIEPATAAGRAPVLAVQWHPEEMPCELHQRLFANFIALAACGQPVGQ